MPADRLEQLQFLLAPPPETLHAERLAAQYAADALDKVRRHPEQGLLPAWEQMRWFTPHIVAIVDVLRLPLRQPVTTRADIASTELRRRGEIISEVTVPTRFHATLTVQTLLEELHEFRYDATDSIKIGGTQTWISDAPPVSLSRIARTHRGEWA